MIEFGHATHTGLARAHNEDTYWADADLGLFVVAGGIGGPGRGELASTLACRAVVSAVQRGQDLAAAITAADQRLGACARERAGKGPLGATLAILQVGSAQYTAASVGDAQLFGWSAGRMWHIDNAAPEPAPPAPHPVRRAPPVVVAPPHRSTQALGITPHDELRARPASGTLERGTQFLVCSDGIADELDRGQIAAILARTELAAQECVDHLVLAALDAGGHDNLTALLVRIA